MLFESVIFMSSSFLNEKLSLLSSYYLLIVATTNDLSIYIFTLTIVVYLKKREIFEIHFKIATLLIL